MRRFIGATGLAVLVGGTFAGAVACNALVDAPDSFVLRPSGSACDGACLDAEPADAKAATDGASMAPRGPDPLSPWPMLGGNAGHTARSDVTASTLGGKLAHWQVKPGVPPSSGPVVDGDGAAYFTTTAGKLISVALDGTIRWSRDLGGASRCSPALGNGAVYATAKTGLTAHGVDGVKLWSVTVGGGSSPVVTADGTVIVTDVAGVHAVTPEGTIKWSYASPGGVDLRGDAVAVDDDGVIYAVRKGLHALSPDGVALWVVPWGDFLSPPPVLVDGKVYIGSGSDLVAVRTSDHGVAWKRAVTSRLRASPSIDAQGRLYYVSGTELEWVSPVDGVGTLPLNDLGISRPFQAAVDGRGRAYLATRMGADGTLLTTFDKAAEKSETWTLSLGDGEPLGMAFGRDGTVFVSVSSPTSSEPGYVIAIRP